MFKKSLALFLVVILLTGMLGSFSVGAAEADKSADTSQVKTFTMKAEDNIATYHDENGNEIDITENNAKRKMRAMLPSSYDLRDYHRSTSVKDQGNYGFCWSFASTASMESNLITKGLANDTLDLSEAGNSWFLHTNTDDTSSPIYNDYLDDENKGSNGGIAQYAADSLSSGFGAYPEELVSYDNFGSGYSDALRFYSDFRLKEYTQLTNDIDLIKQKIIDNGAVYYTYNSFSSNYYYAENGMQTYYDDGTSLDGLSTETAHAVTIVGWDDNFSKDNFNPEFDIKNDGAWLCKNSWGKDYQEVTAKGYEGYFWVSYESHVYDVSQFEMQEADSFDNIYQHQATGNVYLSADTDSCFFSAANIFTANSKEQLEQICFSNIGQTEVTTKVYKLNDNYSSPVDGELLTQFTTNVEFSGTHCVDCPEDIIFNEGDIFSVVVEGNNLITKFKDAGYWESDTAGKSYVSVRDNEWIDCADDEGISYAAVKAYTKSFSVDKTKLSDLIEQAKTLEAKNKLEQGVVDEIKALIPQTEKLLADKNATNNDINNAYCVLNSKCDTLKNYSLSINNIEDFQNFYNSLAYGTMKSQNIELNTDIDFSDIDMYTAPGNFNGTFNGNGHTIKNFTSVKENDSSSFFNTLRNAVIKDVVFDSACVDGNFFASVIADSAINSQFINCSVKNSTIKALEGMTAAVITSSSTNCMFTNCTIDNCMVVGGYTAELFFNNYDTPNTIVDCKASNYTLMSYSYVSDNQGFECSYDANNYDACPAITVTDDSCTYEEFIGEIESVELNGEKLTAENGVYHIEKTNGTVCPYFTFNEIKPTQFGFIYDLTSKTATVDGYWGTDSEIIIPSEIFNMPVVALSDAFKCPVMDTSEVKSISIPGSIKSIPDGCFSYFSNLKSLTLGEGVEVIGNDAFEGCENLSEIYLPDSLHSIGDYAFLNCKVKSVTLGKNIESIGEYSLGYQFGESDLTKIDDFIIHGYKGTVAKNYANENGFTFIPIC